MNIILGSVSIVLLILGLSMVLVKLGHKLGWKEGYSEGRKAADNWWIGVEAEAHTMRQQIWKDEARL
jgi:fatty-acid desaturase